MSSVSLPPKHMHLSTKIFLNHGSTGIRELHCHLHTQNGFFGGANYEMEQAMPCTLGHLLSFTVLAPDPGQSTVMMWLAYGDGSGYAKTTKI